METTTNDYVRLPGIRRFSGESVFTRMDTNKPDSEHYLTTKELSERFHLKERTVRDWNSRYEDFPALKLPGEVRIRVSDFLVWLEQFKRVRKFKILSGDKEIGTGDIETTEVR